MDASHKRMQTAELALAHRNPINEAAYTFDDETKIDDQSNALGLYRSLIPKIKTTSFKMMNYDNNIRQKHILKEFQIEKLINLDITADDK